jgi:hypothetical protein
MKVIPNAGGTDICAQDISTTVYDRYTDREAYIGHLALLHAHRSTARSKHAILR